MSEPQTKSNLASRLKSRPVLIGAGVLLALVLVVAIARPKKTEASGGYYTVKRGDFLISVVEGGTIQAVNEVSIRNEMEGSARVIYIIPEGTFVKKGDLLVEFDSSSAQDEVNQQKIAVEKAEYALVAAQETLAIQKSVVESDIRAAELKLEFAEKDLTKFREGEALQETRKAENDVASFREKLTMDSERLDWSKKLYEQGFETKNNLDRDQLTYLQTQISLEMATNSLWLLKEFDHPKQLRLYESAVEEAKEELKRVQHQGKSKLAQYEADVRTQEITLSLSKDRLARHERQLEASKIKAPQDGLVVYSMSDNRFSSESLIEEGATVRNRQTLIKLPDTSEMKLSIKIHESHINMVRVGQPAFVVLDSMPDQRFRGVVTRVGLLPDTANRWGNPNLKVYATEVLIRDPLPDVKPGVSARAEVIITNLQNVISVPIQAVATRQGKPVVYLAGGAPTARPVEVGLYNTKYIEILSGLDEGERILLAPPYDVDQKDLGGGIVGAGEDLGTNMVVMSDLPERARSGGEGGERRRPEGGVEGGGAEAPRGGGGRNGGSPRGPGGEGGGEAGVGQEGGARPGGAAGGRPNFEALRAEFDKDGDGELSETEREAMRSSMRERFGQGGGRGRPDQAGQPGAGSGEGGRRSRPNREGRPEGGSGERGPRQETQ